jgi:hypothetical protein
MGQLGMMKCIDLTQEARFAIRGMGGTQILHLRRNF